MRGVRNVRSNSLGLCSTGTRLPEFFCPATEHRTYNDNMKIPISGLAKSRFRIGGPRRSALPFRTGQLDRSPFPFDSLFGRG